MRAEDQIAGLAFAVAEREASIDIPERRWLKSERLHYAPLSVFRA
jgi:hypothetical protein